MKRILSITMIALLVFAAPIALGQKPGKQGKDKDDGQDQLFPGGRVPRSQPPQPPPTPPQPKIPQDDPRIPKSTGGKSGLDGGKTMGPPQSDPRRFNPPPRNPENPTPGSKSSGQPDPRRLNQPDPKTFGQPDPKNYGQPDPRRLSPTDPKSLGQPQGGKDQQLPNGPTLGKKPEINAPSRGNDPPRTGNPKLLDGPKNDPRGGDVGKGGRQPSTLVPGKTPDPTPGPGIDEPARRRLPPVSPSGKRANIDDGAVRKGTGVPVNSGGGQPNTEALTGRNPLGKPSQPKDGKTIPEGAVNATAAPSAKQTLPAIASNDVKKVDGPSRLQRVRQDKLAAANELEGRNRGDERAKFIRTPPPKKNVPPQPVQPAFDPPQGGRVYHGNDYQYEYAHHSHSSWSLGIGISDGSTSIAFGYNSGGCGWGGNPYGCAYHPCYNPYWHPCWYAPVVYQPCWAVPVYSPVYYSPAYYPVVVDPWAYNSSSFAFGYSSFGGSALTSFSFAYSSSHWGIGIGWTSAPAYTIYTPVYDPYFRSVWIPGYYQIASERAWVPGSYEEVVSTPVVDTVVDPLGNSYDAVTQPGSVDYVWKDGYWTVEDRRIWVPGHFEYVSAF